MSLDLDYQGRCHAWAYHTVGEQATVSQTERALRFLEEAIELVQAAGVTWHNVSKVAAQVYDRPAGRPRQEVGGVMLTLGAFCEAASIDLVREAEGELERVQNPAIVAKVRARQAEKLHQF